MRKEVTCGSSANFRMLMARRLSAVLAFRSMGYRPRWSICSRPRPGKIFDLGLALGVLGACGRQLVDRGQDCFAINVTQRL